MNSKTARNLGICLLVALIVAAIAIATLGGNHNPAIAKTANTGTSPSATFAFTTADLKATFDASASENAKGEHSGLTYAWDFGDKSKLGSGVKPEHPYAKAGSYNVQLTVSQGSGKGVQTDSMTQAVTVTAPKAPPAPNANTIAKLAIGSGSLMGPTCVDLVREHGLKVVDGVYSYNTNEVYGAGNERVDSDSLSTPLGTGGLKAVQTENCLNPLYGRTNGNMAANLVVGGTQVLTINPWLAPVADVTRVNDVAVKDGALFVPSKAVSEADATDYVKDNKAYQEYANKLNTLLSRFTSMGVQTLPSAKNWHLNPTSILAVGDNVLPEVSLDPLVDKKPSANFGLTQKNACAPLLFIGFNLSDKRPEVFKTPTCKPVVKHHNAPPPKVTSPPKTPPPSETTTTPPPPTTATTTPSTTPSTTPPSTSTTTTTTTTTSTTTSTPLCPSGPSKGQPVNEQPHGICPSGKTASNAPSPTGGPVVQPPPGGYVDRSGGVHSTPYQPPSNTSSPAGKGDSGPGATNTTTAPSAPSTITAPSSTATVTGTVAQR